MKKSLVGAAAAADNVDEDEELDFLESVEDIKKAALGDSKDVVKDLSDEEEVEDDAVYDDDAAEDAVDFLRSVAPVVLKPLQSPFQPSSTVHDDKKRRYLAWNNVGIIVSREESMNNRIEIKFANINGPNKQEAFSDLYGFTIAALSYEGAFFASDPEEPETEQQREDPNRPGSVVYYKAFVGQKSLQGVNEDFTVTLPREEVALCVAVGEGWAAVATSKGFLRIFSCTGLQLSVTWLKGPVLCMTGARKSLAIVYHVSSVGVDTPELAVEHLELTPGTSQWRLIAGVRVPISPGATLTWLGFAADSDYLVAMDSAGVVSALMKVGGWSWVPVVDVPGVRKSVDHRYWPVAVKQHKLLYVLLNGENKPAVHPQPVVSNVLFAPLIAESREGKDRGANANARARQFVWDGLKADHTLALLTEGVDDPLGALQRTYLTYEVMFYSVII